MAGPGRRALTWSLFVLTLTLMTTPAGAEELRHHLTDTSSALRFVSGSGFRALVLDGGDLLREPGRPELPVRYLKFVIPEGLAVTGVSLESGAGVAVADATELPVAEEWISSEGKPALALSIGDLEPGPWPSERVAVVADQFRHGYHLVTVEVRLLQVSPDGRVLMFEEPTVVLDLAPDPAPRDMVRRERDLPGWNAALRAEVRQSVVNPQDLDRAGGPAPVQSPVDELVQPGVAPSLNSSPVRHLILTTEALRPEFQRLADHRTNTGLPSLVVTLEEVVANARQGVDLAETIREYVRDAYSWWGVDYLLLGGDTEILPTRYARNTFYPAGSFTDIPTDHYYACLDGDWNADGDGIFGEHFANATLHGDFIDLEAELAVGRAPVRDLDGARVFVDKILAYEMPADTSWQQNVLLASEVLFPSNWTTPGEPITTDGAAISEALFDTIFDPCADPSLVFDRYYQNYTVYPGAIEETKTDVFNALNSGGYGVFHHIGHGFYFNMSIADAQLGVSDADALRNGSHTFLLYSLNCSSSAFDFNCLNERFLNNPLGGSVISIGSSRAAFPSEASDFQKEFYRAWMCGGLDRVGDVFIASRAPALNNTFYNTLERWTELVYCLLGDPATRLWGATPQAARFDTLPVVTLGDEQFQVTVTTDDGLFQPLSGVTVTARKGLESYAVEVTDGLGQVNFNFKPETTGNIDVWLSGGGVVPVSSTATVVDGGMAVVSVQGTSLADDGSLGSSGNGNGAAEAGETVALVPLFVNGGSVPVVVGGSAILRSFDPWVSVSDSTVAIGAIEADSVAWAGSGWLVTVSPDAPDGHSTVLEVLIQPAAGADRLDHIAFGLAAPEAEIALLVIDDSSGNADGIADTGEDVDLLFSLKNYGTGAATGLSATLSVVQGAGTILDAASSWPDLPTPLSIADNAGDPFRVRVDGIPDSVLFEISLTDAQGRSHVRQFDLVAPAAPVNLILADGNPVRLRVAWDPSPEADLMGYLLYRKGPGEPGFTLDSPDVLVTASTFESTNLIALSNYEFQVVAVDSAGLASPASLPLTTSTFPPEISCFPVPMGLESSGALAVGTIDHDQAPELVVGSELVYVIDGNCTEKLDGDGDSQTLGPINGLSGQYQPSGIALGDLFNDELGMEIVAHDRDSRKLYVLDDQGNVMPGWPQTLMNWAWSTPVIGDLDNDGDLEIVINDIGGYTYAFHHDGSEVADGDANPATFGVIAPRRSQDVGGTIYTEWFGRATPALFDVDGDGNLEILFGSKYQNLSAPEFFYALKTDGTGQNAVGWPKQFPGRSEFLASATVADLEGDGIYEIIAISENDSLYVWDEFGNSRPGFPIMRTQDSVKANSVTPSPAVADFDNDGTLEIVFVSVVKLGSKDWVSRIEILGADGTTWPGWPVEAPDLSEGSPVVGDIDGDGSLDIVYGIGGATDSTDGIYAFDVNGASLAGFPIPIDGFVRATPTICDLNGDGNVNLVSASWDRQIHVWDLLAPYDEVKVPWGTFMGNVNRTGVHLQFVDTAAPEVATVRRTRLGSPHPNPFNPSTELSFELDVPSSDLRLSLYDAQGRRVRTLATGEYGAGVHRVRWDGTDERGRPVASGVYYARLQVGGSDVGVRKLALVK